MANLLTIFMTYMYIPRHNSTLTVAVLLLGWTWIGSHHPLAVWSLCWHIAEGAAPSWQPCWSFQKYAPYADLSVATPSIYVLGLARAEGDEGADMCSFCAGMGLPVSCKKYKEHIGNPPSIFILRYWPSDCSFWIWTGLRQMPVWLFQLRIHQMRLEHNSRIPTFTEYKCFSVRVTFSKWLLMDDSDCWRKQSLISSLAKSFWPTKNPDVDKNMCVGPKM